VRVTVIAAGFDGGEPSLRIDPVTTQRQVPALPALSAEDAAGADDVAGEERDEREKVSVAATLPESSSYDSVFGDDDLDIPDFLK
jgi:cell division protein FtsZ